MQIRQKPRNEIMLMAAETRVLTFEFSLQISHRLTPVKNLNRTLKNQKTSQVQNFRSTNTEFFLSRRFF